METKHTKGEWFTEQSHTFSNRVNIITKKQRKVFTIEHADSEYVTKEEADANTKLIAAAPKSLKQSIVGYLFALVYMPTTIRTTLFGQSVLSSMLSTIVDATGWDHEETHDMFSYLENNVKTGIITIEQAIKKATE